MIRLAEIIFNKSKQVVNSLTIQINGSNKITFNGSSAGTINITPAAIGASPSNHTHTWSSIQSKPSTFPPSSHNHDSLYYQKNVSIYSQDGYLIRCGLYQDGTGRYVWFRRTDGVDNLVKVDKTDKLPFT